MCDGSPARPAHPRDTALTAAAGATYTFTGASRLSVAATLQAKPTVDWHVTCPHMRVCAACLVSQWNPKGGSIPAGHLVYFPEQKCLDVPHIIQGAFAILFIPAWIGMSYLYISSTVVPSPISKEILAQGDRQARGPPP